MSTQAPSNKPRENRLLNPDFEEEQTTIDPVAAAQKRSTLAPSTQFENGLASAEPAPIDPARITRPAPFQTHIPAVSPTAMAPEKKPRQLSHGTPPVDFKPVVASRTVELGDSNIDTFAVGRQEPAIVYAPLVPYLPPPPSLSPTPPADAFSSHQVAPMFPSDKPRPAGKSAFGQKPSAVDGLLRDAFLQVTIGPDQGRRFALNRPRITVGRAVDNDIVLTDIAVSRRHLAVEFDGARFGLADLGSGNGTVINGRLQPRDYSLQHGDVMQLGNTTMRFESSDAPAFAANRTTAGMPEFAAAFVQRQSMSPAQSFPAMSPAMSAPAGVPGAEVRRPTGTMAPPAGQMGQSGAFASSSPSLASMPASMVAAPSRFQLPAGTRLIPFLIALFGTLIVFGLAGLTTVFQRGAKKEKSSDAVASAGKPIPVTPLQNGGRELAAQPLAAAKQAPATSAPVTPAPVTPLVGGKLGSAPVVPEVKPEPTIATPATAPAPVAPVITASPAAVPAVEKTSKPKAAKAAKPSKVKASLERPSFAATPAASNSKVDEAREKASELYSQKRFADAADVLIELADSAGKKQAAQLKAVAAAYERVGNALESGDAASSASVALKSYSIALKADADAGDGEHEELILSKIAKVAPKAATSLMAQQKYVEAKAACDTAAKVGSDTGACLRVRESLDRKVKELLSAAAKSDNAKEITELAQEAMLIAEKGSDLYTKAAELAGE